MKVLVVGQKSGYILQQVIGNNVRNLLKDGLSLEFGEFGEFGIPVKVKNGLDPLIPYLVPERK
jgi:hypothetical protein